MLLILLREKRNAGEADTNTAGQDNGGEAALTSKRVLYRRLKSLLSQ
ncbi:hypothetical protein [Jiulongibacter sp. NS-SX5]